MQPAGKYIYIKQDTESALQRGLIVPFPKKKPSGIVVDISKTLDTVIKIGDRVVFSGLGYEMEDGNCAILEDNIMYVENS